MRKYDASLSDAFTPESAEMFWQESSVKVNRQAVLVVKTSFEVTAVEADGERLAECVIGKDGLKSWFFTRSFAEDGEKTVSVRFFDGRGRESEISVSPVLTVKPLNVFEALYQMISDIIAKLVALWRGLF